MQRLNEHIALRTLFEEHTTNLKRFLQPRELEVITQFDTITQNSFNKYKSLMKYEDLLKNSCDARKQLVSFTDVSMFRMFFSCSKKYAKFGERM